MPYLGNTPSTSFATVTKDTFSGDGSTVAFTLSKIATTNSVSAFVSNVRQEPTTAYAVSGTTLTFTSAPPNASNNIYVLHMNPTSTATHPAAQNLTAVDGTFTGDVTITDDLNVGDDLTLGSDGAIIKFGADSEITLTHSADAGLLLKTTSTSDDTYPSLVMQTGETDIAVSDILGRVAVQAPDEGTGTDAIVVGADIIAFSEGNFAADNNATSLSLRTASSGAVSTVLQAKSDGSVTVANGLTLTDGNITVASGHGISFAATSDGTTMSSELLEDYEEGTWTAAFQLGSGSVTINSSFNTGQYIKIGHLVYFNIHCRVSAVSSPSGKFDITGLPFNFGDNGASRCRVSLSVWAYIAGSGLTAGDSFQAMGTEDTDEITIHKGNKGETNYFNHIGSHITTDTEFSVTGVYTGTI